MKKINLIVLFALLFVALAGCGATGKGASTSAVNTVEMARDEAVSELQAGTDGNNNKASNVLERKIARSASVVLIVSDVKESVSKIEEMIKGTAGYIQDATIWEDNSQTRGKLILRVPAGNLDNILPRLESLGQLQRKNVEGNDVTEEYYDKEARMKTLEKQEKRLLELMDIAKTVKEMLEIENELARIRGEIESLQARIVVLDNLTSLATVNIELRSPSSISPGGSIKEPLGQRLKAGWMLGINSMISLVEAILILLAVMIPYTPVLIAAGFALYYIWRKRRPKG
jgi:hypothetical protein